MQNHRLELFDTCILIDYLNGLEEARSEIEGALNPAISHITWVEVMVGTTAINEMATRNFLGRFRVLVVSEPIGERAVAVRKGNEPGLAKKPKLPDALILATARVDGRVLVTRNTKDFSSATPGVRIPGYGLSH